MTNSTVTPRTAAAKLGLTHFFTGEPCKNGHVADRYTSTGNCKECQLQYGRKFTRGQPGTFKLVAQVDARDLETVYGFLDYVNAQRGLPPVKRGGVSNTATAWEVMLSRETVKPPHARPSLAYLQNAAKLLGIPETYSPGAVPPAEWAVPVMPPTTLSQFTRNLDRVGYAPDER